MAILVGNSFSILEGKEVLVIPKQTALYGSFKVLLLCAFTTSDFNLVDYYCNGVLVIFTLPTWA